MRLRCFENITRLILITHYYLPWLQKYFLGGFRVFVFFSTKVSNQKIMRKLENPKFWHVYNRPLRSALISVVDFFKSCSKLKLPLRFTSASCLAFILVWKFICCCPKKELNKVVFDISLSILLSTDKI